MKHPAERIERQAIEWEKIFANHRSDKTPVSRIYKEPSKHKSKKANDPTDHICTRDVNRHFSEEKVQMAKKNKKICSTLLAITEVQMKTTMTYHNKPTKMAKIKKE